MLVYQGIKSEFSRDVLNNSIADKIKETLAEKNITNNNVNEYRSWENSLRCMHLVLSDKDIDDNCHVETVVLIMRV